MIDPTTRRRSRFSGALLGSCFVLLLLAAGCSNSNRGDPSIAVDEDRTEAGDLEGLTVTGTGFTPNGTVLVTMLMSATGGNANPYVEEQISADAEGEIRLERRPVPCPQPADYERGNWTSVTARDMTTGISGSERVKPGGVPDCRP